MIYKMKKSSKAKTMLVLLLAFCMVFSSLGTLAFGDTPTVPVAGEASRQPVAEPAAGGVEDGQKAEDNQENSNQAEANKENPEGNGETIVGGEKAENLNQGDDLNSGDQEGEESGRNGALTGEGDKLGAEAQVENGIMPIEEPVVDDSYWSGIPASTEKKAATQFIIRGLDKQGNVTTQKVYDLNALEKMSGKDGTFGYYTLYCGMAGPGAVRVAGLTLKDLLRDAGISFAAGDTLKMRTTDCVKDADGKTRTDAAFELVTGKDVNLETFGQDAYYGRGTYTYERLFGTERYYFPGYFKISDSKKAEYNWGDYLKDSTSLKGAVEVEPMLGLTFPEEELYPENTKALEPADVTAKLDDAEVNRDDALRFCAGQLMASDADGKVGVSSETTRWSFTYNVFGIDIIEGDENTSKVAPAMKTPDVTRGCDVKITYADDNGYTPKVNKVTLVNPDGNAVDLENETDYTLSLGNLVVKEQNFAKTGKYTVKIEATGYQTVEVSVKVKPVNIAFVTNTVTLAGQKDISFKLNGVPTDWMKAVKTLTVDNVVLDSSQYDIAQDKITFHRTAEEPIFKSDINNNVTERSQDYKVIIKAPGFDEVSAWVTATNYNARSFYVRHLDNTGKQIGNMVTYRLEDLMQDKASGGKFDTHSDVMYQTYCSMAGLRNFNAEGVYLEDILKDALPGVAIDSNAIVQVRTNDQAAANDPAGEDAYYGNARFTYGHLMLDKRYYFPAVFEEGALKDLLKAKDTVFTGANGLPARQALGKSAGAEERKTMIAWNYQENVFKSNQDKPLASEYSDLISNERSFRFLFSLAMENQNAPDTEAAETANETTTWAATYSAFGVDIIDPADKAALNAAIEKAEAAKESSYTAANYKALQEQLTAAKKMAAGSTDLQGAIDKQAAALEKALAATKSTGGGGSGGSSSSSSDSATAKATPKVATGSNGKTSLSGNGTKLTVTPDDGYQVKDVLVNGVSKGAVTSLTGLKSSDKVEVTFEKIPPATPAVSFTDVPAGHWAAEAVEALAGKGIINGKGNGFAPNDNITRSEFVKLLAGVSGEAITSAAGSSFSDVDSSAWYADYVAWASNSGIVQGAEGKFSPNAAISRQEMAVMIDRLSKHLNQTLPGSAEVKTFADAGQIASYATAAVQTMQKAGILSGKEDGTFAPTANATRAEAAKMLYGLLQTLA